MRAANKLSASNYNSFASIATGSKALVSGTPEELLVYLKEFATTLVPDLKTCPEIHISYMDETVAEFSTAVAYYMNSLLDSYDHEYITLNPLSLSNKNNTLSTLAYEGYPGHLYSYVFSKESNIHNVNKIMKNLTFGEGWATYVQLKLFKHIENSSVSQVKKIACDYLYYDQLLSYLSYSRVDAGINYEGWSINEVLTYFNEVGFSFDYAGAKNLYNTLIEMPAEYPAYGYGMAAYVDIHNQAIQELGEFYNEIDFNRAIQSKGWVTMEKLYEMVDEYIVEQKTLYGIK